MVGLRLAPFLLVLAIGIGGASDPARAHDGHGREIAAEGTAAAARVPIAASHAGAAAQGIESGSHCPPGSESCSCLHDGCPGSSEPRVIGLTAAAIALSRPTRSSADPRSPASSEASRRN